MEKAQEETGYLIADMRFMYSGKQLEKGRKLIDYGMDHFSTVYLVMRLTGGGDMLWM